MKSIVDIVLLGVVAILVFPLTYLPKFLADGLARFYLGVMLLLVPRYRRVAARNLELAFPELSQSERDAIFERSLMVMARSLVGVARIPQLNSEQASKLLDYHEQIEVFEEVRSRKPGKGLLLVCMHFGHPEFFIQLHALRYRPSYILARGFGLTRVDQWVNRRRELFGHKIFGRKGGYQEVVKRLNEGHDVMVLFDQNVKRNHAVFTDFFNIQAATTKTVAIAALRTDCEILLGTALQTADGTYELKMDTVPNPNELPGTTEEQIYTCTAMLNKLAEAHIRRYPEGWMWFHRRWKTRPPGEPENLYA